MDSGYFLVKIPKGLGLSKASNSCIVHVVRKITVPCFLSGQKRERIMVSFIIIMISEFRSHVLTTVVDVISRQHGWG